MVEKPVILFDGVCNLCNSAVQFVIKRDKEEIFHFSSLQSEFGQKTLSENNLDTKNLSSFILKQGNKVYFKSTAALNVAKLLGGWIALFWVFIIIPKPIRDTVYQWVANNRYRWFGKKEECWLPTQELKKRFIN